MNWFLYAIFALSGTTALAFETLWFRQAGLTFGNSVWASSLVLSSFMAGIALGNGFAARYAARTRRPIVAYAILEFIIAISGLVLVFTLPAMTDAIVGILRPFFDQPLLLNSLRLTVGFLVLLAPATAMGATLPLVVRAMHARDPHFGSVLGRLYAVNTLGAMVGAVIGEAFLIEWLGIRGSALFAAGLGVTAGGCAMLLARRMPAIQPAREDGTNKERSGAIPLEARFILAAAFASGGILLALEVVWFRFLHLFAHGGGLAFALMLASVLLGIGLGGAVGGIWVRHFPAGFKHAASVAFVSGCVCIAIYAGFVWVIDGYGDAYIREPSSILWLAFSLTFGPSLLSGILFTLMGAALERSVAPDSRATGLLTMSNTIGAGLGSIVGGFVLLPSLGMERSFWLLAIGYGLVGLLLVAGNRAPESTREPVWRGRGIAGLCAAALVATSLLFPWGLMERDYLDRIIKRYRGQASDVVAVREGVLQTNIYLGRYLDGEMLHLRLITDGYSMSGTAERNRRYMKLFVYWPVAFHPDPKRALLISYGVGETAKALSETRNLEHIDVVDISPEIVQSSGILFEDPADDPLSDPRVRVHIEDGRYFLKSTRSSYDLITGEPPPPKIAGVVNLYTREYFQLIRDRLNPGGLNTYWLPVHNLLEADSKAIIRAYCDVFEDCALWSGIDLDWMLTGSNGATNAPPQAEFERQWRDEVVGRELRTLGIDSPALLGTLFMAGPDHLRALTADTPPLVDDFPKRVSNEIASPFIAEVYASWIDAERSRERFRTSEYIARNWPPALRNRALEEFDYQRMLNDSFRSDGLDKEVIDLHRVLSETPYRFLAVRLLKSSGDIQRAVSRLVTAGARKDRYPLQLGVSALADRQYAVAARHFAKALRRQRSADRRAFLYLYALCMSGDRAAAQELATAAKARFARSDEGRRLRVWFRRTFDLEI